MIFSVPSVPRCRAIDGSVCTLTVLKREMHRRMLRDSAPSRQRYSLSQRSSSILGFGSLNGVDPAEIGIDLRNRSCNAGDVSTFITASFFSDPVTLLASGPRHWCHA